MFPQQVISVPIIAQCKLVNTVITYFAAKYLTLENFPSSPARNFFSIFEVKCSDGSC